MEYKRPTKVLELPSGKKVEIVSYFSKSEIDEFRAKLLGGQKISSETLVEMNATENDEDKKNTLLGGLEFDLTSINKANDYALKTAVIKLIDIDGTEYEATEKSINDFVEEADGEFIQKEINELNKKKLEVEKSLIV